MKTLKYAAEYLLCMLFPNRCVFCGKITPAFEDACCDCKDKLSRIVGDTCPRCGCMKIDCTCGGKHGGYYKAVAAPLYYEDGVKKCIYNLKFGGSKNNYKYLSKLMADTCKSRFGDVEFDCIAYIPMSSRSRRRRGYNQSELMAKAVSEKLRIPLAENLLIKLFDTPNQHNCSATERRGNLLGVFDVSGDFDLTDKTVLLIDDVKTSGTTLNECGKMLLLYGAKDVYCLTAAVVKSKISDNEISKEGKQCREQK